jgi:hypothetical protein
MHKSSAAAVLGVPLALSLESDSGPVNTLSHNQLYKNITALWLLIMKKALREYEAITSRVTGSDFLNVYIIKYTDF